MDLSALETAYRNLLGEARTGGFSPPADTGAWPAELILAHVAANDRLLSALVAEVLADAPASYRNDAAYNTRYLHAVARAAGNWDGLVATVRASGLELVLLARQLDGAQARVPVTTRIVDGQTVRVDGPVPLSGLLHTHAEVHLPGRVEQLGALRSN